MGCAHGPERVSSCANLLRLGVSGKQDIREHYGGCRVAFITARSTWSRRNPCRSTLKSEAAGHLKVTMTSCARDGGRAVALIIPDCRCPPSARQG